MTDDRFSKRDLDRNEDPHAIAGAVAGAAGAGIGAGAGLAVLGPIGAVIGALAGAAGGWWTGKEVQGAVEEMGRAENRFRRGHEHAGATRPYEEVRHGYQLGYLAGRNPENEGRGFADIEGDLRAAWVNAHVHDTNPIPWDEVRVCVRTGYEAASDAVDADE